jgi:hypothetical protein
MKRQAEYWDLEAFLDSLILELDRAQDTLALKGLTRRLTYTVKDAALELQIFPRYDEGRIRFAAAAPGETGASRLSLQLGSITDRQIRESANEPARADDVAIDSIEGLDEDVRDSLRRVGITSARDLERVEERNVDVSKVVKQKTGSKKGVSYDELAQLINKAKRRQHQPRVARVSTAADVSGMALLLEGDHLATQPGEFPVAMVNGEVAEVLEAAASRLRIALPGAGLRPGSNRVEVALDPYAVMQLSVTA